MPVKVQTVMLYIDRHYLALSSVAQLHSWLELAVLFGEHFVCFILFSLIYIQTMMKQPLCLDNDGSAIEMLDRISFKPC